MATSRNEISQWFDRGVAQGATHMIVVCDTFDWDDYPHYVKPGENPRDYKPGEMQRIMEVYQLDPSKKQEQMNEFRAFHYDPLPEK